MGKRKVLKQEVEKILDDENALLIYPPENSPTMNETLDIDKLEMTFKMGKREAGKIQAFIR